MILDKTTLTVFLSAARCAQVLDPRGASAAANGITMQIQSLGVVAHLEMQGVVTELVS